jgi:hypothetical protein
VADVLARAEIHAAGLVGSKRNALVSTTACAQASGDFSLGFVLVDFVTIHRLFFRCPVAKEY